MTVLLDTHVLLWSFISPASLSRTCSGILSDKTSEIFVSAASAWEIATKVRIGKLPEATELESHFMDALSEVGFSLIPIEAETALHAGRLPAAHGDPFDRIIAAQALDLAVPILSKDAQLDAFGIRRIW
ncbi:MAG TPA: type II toxin-antitoxin system VapC family toxin [Acidobacteriaceae bacterium]|nr:type II toxin-antitoxin system VapC family toxin [Acidobacteriaceae bacterium]